MNIHRHICICKMSQIDKHIRDMTALLVFPTCDTPFTRLHRVSVL